MPRMPARKAKPKTSASRSKPKPRAKAAAPSAATKPALAHANGIVEGVPAPNVTLTDHRGDTWRLSDLRGKHLVLYFYPADMTSGCTTEACEFNASLAHFEGLNTRVIGVSPDDAASHQKFRAKHNLEFPLAFDPSRKAFEAFGVWQEKNLYGRKSMGVVRSTFLIDADGVVRGVWRRVKPDGHSLAVLEAVRSLEKQRRG